MFTFISLSAVQNMTRFTHFKTVVNKDKFAAYPKTTNNMAKNWDQEGFWFWSLMMWEEKPESKLNNGEYHCSLFPKRSVTVGKYVHNTSLNSCHWRVLHSCLFCILDEFSHFFLSLRKMQSKKLFFFYFCTPLWWANYLRDHGNIHANSPRYSTDLLLSRTGHHISWLKSSSELFWDLAHF